MFKKRDMLRKIFRKQAKKSSISGRDKLELIIKLLDDQRDPRYIKFELKEDYERIMNLISQY